MSCGMGNYLRLEMYYTEFAKQFIYAMYLRYNAVYQSISIYFIHRERSLIMAIRIGIMGYGNIGKGIETALADYPDMELAVVS